MSSERNEEQGNEYLDQSKRKLAEVIIKPRKAKNFSELEAIAGRAVQYRPFESEEQAWFKHEITRVRYTLTRKEVALLSEAIGFSFRNITYKGGADAMSMQAALTQVQDEIDRITDINSNMHKFIRFFFGKRVAHLEAARDYLNFYLQKYSDNKNPESRLINRQHRHYSPEKSGDTFRKNFSQAVNKLSRFFSSNQALKELNEILYKKQMKANELKLKYVPERIFQILPKSPNIQQNIKETVRHEKNQKNEKLKKKIASKGILFIPAKLIQYTTDFQKTSDPEKATNFKDMLINIRDLEALDSKISNYQHQIGQKIETIGREAPQEPSDSLEQEFSTASIVEEFEKIENDISKQDSTPDQLENFLKDLNRLKNELVALQKQNTQKFLLKCYLQDAVSYKYEESKKASMALVEKCQTGQMTGFNEDALARIGVFVGNVKTAKKLLVQEANHYHQSLTALLQAKQETLAFLEDLQSKPNLEDILNTEIAKLTYLVAQLIEAVPKAWDANFMVLLKVFTKLNFIQDLPLAKNKDTLPELIEKMKVDLAEEIKQITGEHTWSSCRTKNLIETAKETVSAITHLADHGTTNLCGLRSENIYS